MMVYDTENKRGESAFSQFAPFFANAIVHRPFSQENYEPQLPVDEILKVLSFGKEITNLKK